MGTCWHARLPSQARAFVLGGNVSLMSSASVQFWGTDHSLVRLPFFLGLFFRAFFLGGFGRLFLGFFA